MESGSGYFQLNGGLNQHGRKIQEARPKRISRPSAQQSLIGIYSQ